MRFVLVCVCLSLMAPLAAAQETVSIPFAPAVPSRFVVDEVRTRSFEQNGVIQNRSGRVRATLELRSGDGPYQAVWTTISADPAAIVIDNGGADPTLLIGRPIALTLDDDGAASSMEDWRGVRRGMFRIMLQYERDSAWRQIYSATEEMMESWSPEVAARTLMETINILASCHNTALVLQREESFEVEAPNALNGPPIITRATWELLAVDEAAGVARIRHTRSPNIDSANASANASTEGLVVPRDQEGVTLGSAGSSVVCEVDLDSGMVRSATFEVNLTIGGESETRRRSITLTPP